MNRDLILYVANLTDDRTILNLLSVSKRFRIPENFKRIFQQRYPLIMRFKPENMNWIKFYVEVIHFLGKLKERFNMDYVPTYDFNPIDVYHFVITSDQSEIDSYEKQSEGLHILYTEEGDGVPRISDLIIPRKSLQEGLHYFMDGKYGFASDPVRMDPRQILTQGSTVWIGSMTNPAIFSKGNYRLLNMVDRTMIYVDPEWLVDNLFNVYIYEVDAFVNGYLDNWIPGPGITQPTREQLLALNANNPYNRDQKDLFREKIFTPEGVVLKIDREYPDGEYCVLYFQIVQRKIAIMK